MLRFLLQDDVKVNITFAKIRLKSNLNTKKTIMFTKKSLLFTKLGFTRLHSGFLCDIQGFVQVIPGTYKSDYSINNTAIDKIDLKANCIDGSIGNGFWEPILYSFALDQPPGYKLFREPRIKLFKVKKSGLSHFTFYLQDDDHKAVNFNGETVIFTCQLIKIC